MDGDLGLDRPIREGIEDLNCGSFVIDEEEAPADINEDGNATSEEEKEAGGIPRAKRGSGHWGRAPPLATRKKGISRPLNSGGGLCDPGRWPIELRRRTPRL